MPKNIGRRGPADRAYDPRMTPADAERVLTAYRIGRTYLDQACLLLSENGVPRAEIQEKTGMSKEGVISVLQRARGV